MMADGEAAREVDQNPGSRAIGGISAALKQLDRAVRTVHAAVYDRRAELAQLPTTAEQVRAVIEARQRRSLVFAPDLFSDPGWDLLLELYACALEQWSPSIAQLTVSVGVPGTSVLRWLDILDRKALLTRRDDPQDTRKVRISLSEHGKSRMDRYFAECAEFFLV